LDELYYYEEGHGDALRPIPKHVDKSFLGEHAENHPVTKHEVQAIIHAQFEAATQKLIETFHSAGAGAGQAGTVVNTTSSITGLLRHGKHNPDNPHITHTPTPPEPPHTAIPPDHHLGDQSMPRDLRIPTLPKSGPLAARWKCVVQDWEEPDPSRGHHIPLKDWDPSWYTGPNHQQFGAQYGKCKLIALEFIDVYGISFICSPWTGTDSVTFSCQWHEATFLSKWPMAETGGPSRLLDAIQAASMGLPWRELT